MKENYEKIKDNNRSLKIWSDNKFPDKYDYYLRHEIYYLEVCLGMLKDRHGASKIDLRHFLNAAQLEYLFFIIKENPLPDSFIPSSFQLDGYFTDRRINLIFKNILNAQKNLRILLDYYTQERRHKELFLYNEIMGDLYIHIFCYINKYRENLNDLSREYLNYAFYYYKLSIWHKTQLEISKPRTYFEGLHY